MVWKKLLISIGLVTAVVWSAVIALPDSSLHIVACDVGEGDAILIFQGQTQILTDGGANKKVLDCLARYLPFWDRTIELVILTHPEKDHYGGLSEVLKRYQVDSFWTTKLESGDPAYQVLKSQVRGNGSRVIYPTQGMHARLGLIYLDILHPSEEDYLLLPSGSNPINSQPNRFSIVYGLKYGAFAALLTSDIDPASEEELVEKKLIQPVNYIKVSHHGSKNGLTKDFLEAARPTAAVISVGKNIWGHPHQEVLDLLESHAVKIFRTDQLGDVEVIVAKDKWLIKK